jgi:enamine deaminase RidA (YjgF/YER057c/UK114 family)
MAPEEKLQELGLVLPDLPERIANYLLFKRSGKLVWISGQGPRLQDGSFVTGKVGLDYSLEEAYEHARLVGLDLLAVARAAADGNLDRVEFVKLLGMVNAAPDFAEHGKVIDGCSDLLVEVFGEAGRHARASVGMGSLPGQITVEIEAVIALDGGCQCDVP